MIYLLIRSYPNLGEVDYNAFTSEDEAAEGQVSLMRGSLWEWEDTDLINFSDEELRDKWYDYTGESFETIEMTLDPDPNDL